VPPPGFETLENVRVARVLASVLFLSVALGCGSSKHAGGDGAAGSSAGASGSTAIAGTGGAGGAAGGTLGGSGGDATPDSASGGDAGDALGVDVPAADASRDLPTVAYAPCGPSARYGVIRAAQVTTDVGSTSATLGARFGAGNKVPDWQGCAGQTFGACTAYTCAYSTIVIGPPPPTSAGAVEVSAGAKSITIVPAVDGTYASESLVPPAALWGAGDLLTFSVAGDVVPAFTHRVSALGPLTITVPPTPVAGSRGTLDRTKDLVVTWTNGSGALLELAIDATPAFSGTSYELRCRWRSADGAGVVPSAALVWVATLTSRCTVSSSLTSIDPVSVGDTCVDLETVQDGLAPSGARFGGRYDIP
jgi:hypothetical protein